MVTLLSFVCAHALAAPAGNVITTELRTGDGSVRPQLLIGLVDPPNPDIDPPNPDKGLADPPGEADPPGGDFALDGDVAVTRVKFTEKTDLHVLLGLGGVDVEQITYRSSVDAAPVVVWGRGAGDRIFPPDPCKAVTADLPPGPCTPLNPELPPGPCFELDALLTDGTVLGIAIAFQSEGGELDPGSLVGFNPQPEPPGDSMLGLSFDISAYARDSAAVEMSVALIGDRQVLPLK